MIDTKEIVVRMPLVHTISGFGLLVVSAYMIVYGGWKLLVFTITGIFSDTSGLYHVGSEEVSFALQVLLAIWLGMFGLWAVSGRVRESA